jgi:hypothetical protein
MAGLGGSAAVVLQARRKEKLHRIVVVGEQYLWVTDLSTMRNLNWQMHLVFGFCLLETV